MFFLFDTQLRNRMTPQALHQRSERSNLKADEAQRDILSLQEKLDHLSLVIQSMWELLEKNTTLTREQLLDKIQEVDLRDGKLDGRLQAKAQPCSSCGRRSSLRHTQCMYCGEGLSQDRAGLNL